ncbi:Uncharacterized protein TPAR_05028 [Tolypocladium paradoxum]|uniref:4-hydroxy-2-oxoglutarate aldolase, mitochondrial n=1 Tax=Tolypocladium paradoxum TaxID=94208 RepID=A0A2S4KX70_9HYPO|nr:Uncharacterized protein TPAR_05028 [Tolypocladium paradoxum]
MSPSANLGASSGAGGSASPQRELRRGIYVPTVAFFDAQTDELDVKTTARHVLRLAGAGVAGLAVQGSNGEAVHLTTEERSLVTRMTRSTLDGAGFSEMPLLVGCGAQSTVEAVALCRRAAADGGDYALVLPPSYYSGLFTDSTVVDFFTAVADASPIPIIVYNYPGATPGVDIDSDALIALSAHANVAGCKFTCGNTGKLGRVAASVRATGRQFLCFAGSADFTVSSMAHGAAGVIGGLGNIAPRSNVRLFELAEAGKADEAKRLQEAVASGDWVAIQTGVLGVKVALQEFYGYGGWARKPLPRPDAAQRAKIVDGLKDLVAVERGFES